MSNIATAPIKHDECAWLVKWLRQNKQVQEDQFDLRAFVKLGISEVISQLKQANIKITEEEILIGLRRLAK